MFWSLLSAVPFYQTAISEFIKVGEIALTMVGGSVEDERAFSAMNFLKNKHRNRLDTNLAVCMRMKMQNLYSLNTFPFTTAYMK